MAAPTNVSYVLLDAAVIGGRADEPVVAGTTHARLLEEVAALGGVLHHLGVGPGVPVVVAPVDDQDAVVAALAVARLGGVVHTTDTPDAPVLITSLGSPLLDVVPPEGRHRLVRGPGVTEPDLDWGVMLRAGRTDPAGCAVLEPGSAYSPERTVGDLLADLGGAGGAPYDVAGLRRLLHV